MDNILGSYSIVINSDTAPVEKAFAETEKVVRRFGRTAKDTAGDFSLLDKQTEHASQSAKRFGYSVLYASQGIEDLQYGVRSVLNNIPQFVMAVGGSAGLAGVISIAAVSANLLYEHMDDLTRAFTGQAAALPTLREGLGDVAEQIKEIDKALKDLGWKPGMNIWELPDAAAEGKARHLLRQRAIGEDVLADQKMLGRFGPDQTEAAEKQAKAFQEVIKRLPQGARTLRDSLIQGGMGEWDAQHLIAEALRGDAFSIRSLLRRTKDDPSLKALQDYNPDAKEQAKDREDATHAFDKAVHDLGDDIVKWQKDRAEQNRREEQWKLEDRREALQEERKRVQERMHEIKPSQVFGSGLDYANSVQSGAGQEVRRQQLGKLKDIDKRLEGIRDELKKQQRARFQ